MRALRLLIAALAIALAPAAKAAPIGEIGCALERLDTGQRSALAGIAHDLVAGQTVDPALEEAAEGDLLGAIELCANLHGWSVAAIELATRYTMGTFVIAAARERLVAAGGDPAAVERIFSGHPELFARAIDDPITRPESETALELLKVAGVRAELAPNDPAMTYLGALVLDASVRRAFVDA